MSDDLVRQMNDARDFPANTCGASRHAAMIAEALCSGEDYPMLAEEPDHCGESIATTVAALWKCRTKLAKAVKALQSVIEACDQNRMIPRSGVGGMTIEANIRGSVYTGVPAWPIEEARTTLAELKGQDDE